LRDPHDIESVVVRSIKRPPPMPGGSAREVEPAEEIARLEHLLVCRGNDNAVKPRNYVEKEKKVALLFDKKISQASILHNCFVYGMLTQNRLHES
jgi:hypothetical protein